MQRVAIIGAGVSGLSMAHFLNDKYKVRVYEKADRPGGLIKCRRVNGSLFHTCGGHVFNSKRQDVLDWFWSKLVREKEFDKADRNSVVFMADGKAIPYPIENHVYLFDEAVQKQFYADLDEIDRIKGVNASFMDYENFGDFLRWRFGKTLYNLYFQPYNEKVWRRSLNSVPMAWMEGKLPMPTTKEMRENNANRVEEKSFVHSSFWYEKINGSQYIADKLAEGLDIHYGTNINCIQFVDGFWIVDGEKYDKVVFCGNIKDMIDMQVGVDLDMYKQPIAWLEYHGTTAVFCEIDKNPYSWIYQPSRQHESHRIICTGNFANSNNGVNVPEGRITATIEFTDAISKEDILENLKKIPLHPKYIDHEYNQYTYPIQNTDTRKMIKEIKGKLSPLGFYYTGRFADWEYYNMDVAIGAAMDLSNQI
jgi:protoporphyrinogen oxidase